MIFKEPKLTQRDGHLVRVKRDDVKKVAALCGRKYCDVGKKAQRKISSGRILNT